MTLVGRVVATPELRTTGSGISVTTIRIATNDREVPEFHDVVLWRQQAEFAAKYLAKGRLAYVEGRLQSRTWEGADGSKRRTVEVVADTFKPPSPKRDADGGVDHTSPWGDRLRGWPPPLPHRSSSRFRWGDGPRRTSSASSTGPGHSLAEPVRSSRSAASARSCSTTSESCAWWYETNRAPSFPNLL